MTGLFEQAETANLDRARPLAARMRPRNLDEFVGQQHFLGPGQLLRRILDADRLSSAIFYGPPGTGKTSLAELIAGQTECVFERLNAAAAGVKELRELLESARDRLATGERRTLLFVDELHHFNRTQQDVLLPDVESGVVRLIGATTANPFFSLVSPLVSRSQIFEFQPLQPEDIRALLQRALVDTELGLGRFDVSASDEALAFLSEVADGDARRALNALEIGVLSIAAGTSKVLELEVAEESVQKKAVRYDDDSHYDAASALIKSLRGSDPDAAMYWLARMLEAGEDPRFLARRLVILAAEDVGNADPQALVLANAAAQATERVGMPECRIILAQATSYLALAPKSNASYLAIDRAIEDVRTKAVLPVPRHLQDSHYPGAEKLGHGQDYAYAHDGEDGWVNQDYLGVDRTYYEPTDRGHEAVMKQRLEELKKRKNQ
ncbi:MAG: replication-associated recombination protein A [Planctomycetales bacterium]|nr:replication-associated recombination protein A [Planctomycetales bacterium]